ncbi:hypothetical protein Trichorick_00872 [Candidatus Trichorickettsia mobilis]|uniref:Uncharacterized protein n=1 Tax=Candidatus Trichorickettsia mobilis TaxID=1346319 RepID=A0ABZ0UWJ3_9RICK|nr:hypothetical protein [Candidatus Trichorickettsia mobilis]WPY00982.1 hypothetical protein Trichorick_00872 [Candidatus Trichorickettsia mobilis]
MTQPNTTTFDKEVLQNIFEDLIKDSLIKLAKDLADRILLVELQYLYINKIYDNYEDSSKFTDKFIMDVDLIISKYYHTISDDIDRAIDTLIVDMHAQDLPT